MKKILLIIAMLTLSFTLAACQEKTEAATFTLAELQAYDGQDGAKAYIAVDGIVYDVTDADNWNNGYHNGILLAGTDATAAFESSPHSASILEDLPEVGTLVTP